MKCSSLCCIHATRGCLSGRNGLSRPHCVPCNYTEYAKSPLCLLSNRQPCRPFGTLLGLQSPTRHTVLFLRNLGCHSLQRALEHSPTRSHVLGHLDSVRNSDLHREKPSPPPSFWELKPPRPLPQAGSRGEIQPEQRAQFLTLHWQALGICSANSVFLRPSLG